MLLKNILVLGEPLKNLCSKRLTNFKTSRSLSKILKKVDEETTFYSQEYKKLLDNYAKKDDKGNFIPHGNNSLELKDANSKQKFEDELKELLETDVGTIEIVRVKEKDFADQNDFPTAQEMIVLESIIHWEDETLN